MIYLLDTNVCIEYVNDSSGKVASRMVATDFKQIRLCSIVKAELYFGAFKSRQLDKNLALLNDIFSEFESVPFDDRAAKVYGEVRADLAKHGRPIAVNDLLIGSIALANDFVVVTHNVDDFAKIAGLKIEDWQANG